MKKAKAPRTELRYALWSGLAYTCRPEARDYQRERDLAEFGTWWGRRGWRAAALRAVRARTKAAAR